MKKENRWKHGSRDFVLPPLSEDLKGRHGCSLQMAIFDKAVGEEVYVLYREQRDHADKFSQIAPFNLLVRFGLVETPHGVVAFIVWLIAAGSHQEVMVEQFLDPQNIGALRLVASAANQTHFKLVIIDNKSGQIYAFVDFENVFGFDQLASAMVRAIGHESEGNFVAATQYITNNMTLPKLVVASELFSGGTVRL
jgi:hypothetical protein